MSRRYSDNPTSCAEVRPLLDAFGQDALPPRTATRVEAHLQGCMVCAELFLDHLAAVADAEVALPERLAKLRPPRQAFLGFAAAHQGRIGPMVSGLRSLAQCGELWAQEVYAQAQRDLQSARHLWSICFWARGGGVMGPTTPSLGSEAPIRVTLLDELWQPTSESDAFTITEPPTVTRDGRFVLRLLTQNSQFEGWKLFCTLHAVEGRQVTFEGTVRRAAAQPDNIPDVKTLIRALEGKNLDVRPAAAGILGQIGDPRMAPALLEALGDSRADVRPIEEQSVESPGKPIWEVRVEEPILDPLDLSDEDVPVPNDMVELYLAPPTQEWTLMTPSPREELLVEVTVRDGGGYRLRLFDGFPSDLTSSVPFETLDLTDSAGDEWLRAVEPWVPGRPRVRLCYDPALWELTWRPLEDLFARAVGVPLVRHPLGPDHRPMLPYAADVSVPGKLKVLLIYANPDPARFPAGGQDLCHLPSLHEHFEVLVQALGGLVTQQLVFFDRLGNQDGRLSAPLILERVRTFDPHVIVYVGHGYNHPQFGRNGLYWGDRQEEHLSFVQLRTALAEMEGANGDGPSLRLLMLIACHSAAAGAPGRALLFNEGEGVEAAQVPAVVGMHREFPASAVAAFGQEFFGVVSRRHSLEEAFTAGLRSLREAFPKSAAIAQRPRLWLTACHSHLFPPAEECARSLYLERLKGEHNQIPFAGSLTTVRLEELYVERVVVERKEGGRSQSQPELPLSATPADQMAHLEQEGAVLPGREKVVEIWKALEEHHRVLLLAEARTGKSTLCQHLVMHCQEQTRRIPILIRFSEFTRRNRDGWPAPLLEFIRDEYAAKLELNRLMVLTGIGETAREVPFGEWLYLQWDAGNALLLVDGLDEEFNGERRKQALSQIGPMAPEKAKQPRVLFTSRPSGAPQVTDAYVLHLKEFETDNQLWRCVNNCERILARLEERDPDEQQVMRFMKALGEDRRRKDLARRPGHVVEMYVQFRATGSASLFEEDLMDWVAQERFKIEGRADADFRPSPTLRRSVAEEISFHLLFCREQNWAYEDEMLNLSTEATSPSSEGGSRVERDRLGSLMLADLVRNSGFLHETRVRGRGAYQVESALGLEFFAASYLASRLRKAEEMLTSWVLGDAEWCCPFCRNRTLPLFRAHVQDAAWEAAFLLLIGLVGTESLEAALLELVKEAMWFDPNYPVTLVRLGNNPEVIAKAGVGKGFTSTYGLNLLLKGLSRCHYVHPTIVEAMKREALGTYWWTIQPGLAALGRARTQDNFDPILKYCVRLLGRGVQRQRENAARVLGLFRNGATVRPLRAALKDEDLKVRHAAAWSLGWEGNTQAVEPLIAALQDEELSQKTEEGLGGLDPRCFALASIGAAAVAPLIEALKHEDAWVFGRACFALGMIGDDAVEPLLAALEDEHWRVRGGAAFGLGAIGDTQAISVLIQIANNDRDYHVRDAAKRALNQIGEKNRIVILRDGRSEPCSEGEVGGLAT